MRKHLLVLPDGSEISSGSNGAAVASVKLTRSVNDGQQLSPGAACAAMLEATLLEVDAGRIAAGDALTLFTVDSYNNRQQVGVFLAEKPERTGSHTLKLTAYDRLTLLDRDMTGWLAGLTGWPYALHTLADMVCKNCGLTLVTREIPNGDFPVEKFTADGVTGRQIMMWIAEAACRFCRATPTGAVELAWYTPASVGVGPSTVAMAHSAYINGDLSLRAQDASSVVDGSLESVYVSVTDDENGNVVLTLSDTLQQQCCFQGGLSLEDFTTAPIQKVQLRQDETDVGVVWPKNLTGQVNTYIVTGNPLLTARSTEALQPVAQSLYEQLKDVTYTPGTLKLPAGQPIQPGNILAVTDASERTFTFYVMTSERTGQIDTLTCAGEATRDSTTAFNELSYAPLSGKVLRLRTDVEGIRAENADTAGRVTRLELDLDGIRSQVSQQEKTADGLQEKLTSIEQTANDITLEVQNIRENGTTKVTNEFGLTIDESYVKIHRSGSDMENRLDEKGMYVVRSAGTGNETTMLQADAEGVTATDVTVRNFLVLGDYARFEDYTDGTDSKRTACFWIGE